MGKHSTEQAAGAQRIETLGGDYALKWDDETQMGVNAHAAPLSQFAKAGGLLDRLVERKPRLARGDVSFSSESVIGDCEAADVRYLFKARTAGDPSAPLSRKNHGETPFQPANQNWRGDTPLTSTAIFRIKRIHPLSVSSYSHAAILFRTNQSNMTFIGTL